jgi:hypothetical protein
MFTINLPNIYPNFLQPKFSAFEIAFGFAAVVSIALELIKYPLRMDQLLVVPFFICFFSLALTTKPTRQHKHVILIIAFAIFYVGIKVYRGMSTLNVEGDRDDALYYSVVNLLHGIYPYDKPTFLGQSVTTGPVSILMSVPFVLAFDNINILSVILLFLTIWFLFQIERDNQVPIIPVALCSFLFFNIRSDFWHAAEEIIYGWVFIFLAIALLSASMKKRGTLVMLSIGCLLGIAAMVRIAYVIPISMILLLCVIEMGAGSALVAVAGAVITITFITLPFLMMNPVHFIDSFLLHTWLGWASGDLFGIMTAFLLAALLFPFLWLYVKNLSRRGSYYLLVGVGATFAYLMTGLIMKHVLFWFIPLLFAFPTVYRDMYVRLEENPALKH